MLELGPFPFDNVLDPNVVRLYVAHIAESPPGGNGLPGGGICEQTHLELDSEIGEETLQEFYVKWQENFEK